MLERLYDILFEFKEYVTLALLILLSLFLMTLNDTAQVKYFRSIATVTFGIVQERLSIIPRYFNLWSENEMLRRKNIELADEALRLREAKLENFRLQRLLGLKEEEKFPLTAARIVAKNFSLLRNTIIIDVGSQDGIAPQMPLITEAGLVGAVTMVSGGYAAANILYNTDSRVSIKVQRTRVDGILAWDGIKLSMKNVPKTRDVKVGDVVITSGYSNIYPPNIRVGVVAEALDQPNSLFKYIRIEPAVDFVRLEEVFVVHHQPNLERDSLEQAAIQRFGK